MPETIIGSLNDSFDVFVVQRFFTPSSILRQTRFLQAILF